MTLRVAYIGGYEPDYPRNLVLRRGLELNGATVVECRVSPKLSTRERARAVFRRFSEIKPQVDTLILAEFNNTLALHARRLALRYHKRLVIDFFTSAYDSAVHDRGQISPRSPGALRYWLVDWLALRLADQALVDTAQNRDYCVETFGVDPAKFTVIPVGASREWFDAPPARHDYPGRLVIFYGSYIPLHGVDVILDAADLLRDHGDCHFELIGKGQTYPAIRARAADLHLPNLTFHDPVPSDQLPALVARADICLGIFGATSKAGRVVPNKVYQTLALQKPVITADTPAMRELFQPAPDLVAIPPDPRSLAEAIRPCIDAPPAPIAGSAHALVRDRYSEAPLGRRLLDALA